MCSGRCERRLVSNGTSYTFIYILLPVTDFSWTFFLTIGTGLIRAGSVQFVYIDFQFFFGYSSLSMMGSVRFSIFSFFCFFTLDTMRHGLREHVFKSSALFSKRLLTVSVTDNLPSKNIIWFSSVLDFLVNFSISSFYFFTYSSRFVWRSSSDIAGTVICRFSSLWRGCRCAVVLPVVFVGVAVRLDLHFLFPESIVFVVFDYFVRR